MHPALHSWRDELPSSLVRLLAYLCAVLLLSIAAARLSESPKPIAAISPVHESKWIEIAFYPITVILQVTPIVAIAPLILIYSPSTQVALLICAFLVAFFPILSNMVQGLKTGFLSPRTWR